MAKPTSTTIRIKAYMDAKHNMSTRDIEAALALERGILKVSQGDVQYRKDVIAGYEQALRERK